MSTSTPLDAFEINTYTVDIPVDTSVYDEAAAAKLGIVETVASSIVGDVDHFDPDDAEYIATQVSFDEDAFDVSFDSGDGDVVLVETETRLGTVIDDE